MCILRELYCRESWRRRRMSPQGPDIQYVPSAMGLILETSNHTFPTDPFTSIWPHDEVNQWKHFPRYWPFVRGIHRSLVNSPHNGQWRGALMFSLICAWINAVNNRAGCDLICHRAHYDVTVMPKHDRFGTHICAYLCFVRCFNVDYIVFYWITIQDNKFTNILLKETPCAIFPWILYHTVMLAEE